MADPTVTLTCRPRSPEAVAEAVALVDPENNPNLQRRDIDGDGDQDTTCNWFVSDVTALLSCPVPRVRANDQLAWLKGEGSAVHGWRQVFPVGAIEAAKRGEPVVVGWVNPTGHPGHVAIVRATPADETGIWIAQTGGSNFSLGKLIRGFGQRSPLLFFAHP